MTDEPLEVLDVDECWRLLRTQAVGRFAANRVGQSPHVVPVNFTINDVDQVVIRSDVGSKLDLASLDFVCLEVDEIDPVHHVGWSVVVEGIGRARVATGNALTAATWAPGPTPYALVITPTGISGRRIALHTPETDGRGYR